MFLLHSFEIKFILLVAQIKELVWIMDVQLLKIEGWMYLSFFLQLWGPWRHLCSFLLMEIAFYF